MKKRNIKLILTTILILAASCNDPETVVTNIVHKDGSVTRRIEIRSSEKKFGSHDVQIPYDTTWNFRDSLEVTVTTESQDTIWVRRAEKFYHNVAEINSEYKADSSSNRAITRKALFSRKFRWFHTAYRFEERIEEKLSNGYPVSDFLNDEELAWFYSPEDVTRQKLNSSDSLKFRTLQSNVDQKTEDWFIRCLLSEWINVFADLTGAGGSLSVDSLKARESEFVQLVEEYDEKFDSLWNEGLIMKRFIGEDNALKYQDEADSALRVAEDHVFVSFSEYSVKAVMPGKVTATNGYADSLKILMWPVISDYFFSEPYSMWAESKVQNWWAWIISGLFVVFVFTGIIFTRKVKG